MKWENFFNMETNRVILSRDITWLKKSYGQQKGITGIIVNHISDNETEFIQNPEVNDQTQSNESKADNDPKINRKAINELKKIQVSYNPTAETMLNQVKQQVETTNIEERGRENLIEGDDANILIDSRLLQYNNINDLAFIMIDTKQIDPTIYKDVFTIPTKFNKLGTMKMNFND